MKLDRKKNFRFSEWEPGSGSPNSGDTDSEGAETPILGISSSELHNEVFSTVMKTYAKHKQCDILFQLLQQKYRSPELESQLEGPWLRYYKANRFFLIDGLIYHIKKHTSILIVIERDHISLIAQECHDCPYMGHMKEDRTKERVESTAWWSKWEKDLSEYINTCERCQKAKRKHEKKYGLLQHIEEPKHPWETINMDWVTGIVPGGRENFNACLIIVDRSSKSHSTTGKSPSLVEKGWNPLLPVDHLKKKLLTIHPTAKDFCDMWKRACDTAFKCIAEAKEYNKQMWDRSHMEPDFKEGDQVLVSTLNFNNLKGPKNMRDSFLGPFTIIKLIGKNAVEVKLTEEISRKHPVFPVSLVKPYCQAEYMMRVLKSIYSS
ncbi:hypothetical protein O181_004025 [Austropuccinia psidii MF-1]|uniref:Integrase zinc-binding domain-containing protein n=1 Tax=Austropuccinia psidii MF-1 TaxID=1389203 RepID=A0A9Q3BG61_9BASI|nr:hypothetical protein [Austropuccinia psidii MF-1]